MDLSPSEYQQCPLQFYDFKHIDHSKHCSLYTAVCSTGKTISFDDLETLHTDLSKLKEAVQNRIQLLSSELSVMGDWHVRRNKRKHSDSTDSVKGHQKVSTQQTSNEFKRIKTSQEQTLQPPKKIKGKSKRNESSDIVGSALVVSKTEGADKFWSSLEPYFADITESDLHNLQSLDNGFDKSLFDVPKLGQHYSHQWAMEDIMEEGNETNKLFSKRRTSWQDEANNLLTDSTSTNTTVRQYGPLTQKLIATFIDTPNGTSQIKTLPSQKIKETNLTPSVLEKRLKEELTSLGILEQQPEVNDSSDEDDEVVRELVKAQEELKAVHEYNQHQKKMIYSLAKSEMRRQDIRKQLHKTDQEIMEWLRQFASYRQQKKKKEQIKPKDKETAQKCLEKRQKLIQHLLV